MILCSSKSHSNFSFSHIEHWCLPTKSIFCILSVLIFYYDWHYYNNYHYLLCDTAGISATVADCAFVFIISSLVSLLFFSVNDNFAFIFAKEFGVRVNFCYSTNGWKPHIWKKWKYHWFLAVQSSVINIIWFCFLDFFPWFRCLHTFNWSLSALLHIFVEFRRKKNR